MLSANFLIHKELEYDNSITSVLKMANLAIKHEKLKNQQFLRAEERPVDLNLQLLAQKTTVNDI